MTEREENLLAWLHAETGGNHELVPASSDASFRRYFRIHTDGTTRVVMDAPPPQEDCQPFVHVANLLHVAGMNAPEVIATDIEDGFLILSDLGTTTYLDVLNEDNVDRLYGDAIGALAQLQACIEPASAGLPVYDSELLNFELSLFKDWYLQKHLGMTLDAEQEGILATTNKLLVESALAQTQVCVHRDYHSRNLMFTEQHNPGVLDFQDAVIGPVTYDLVSLLRDCYISWPRERVEEWVQNYYQIAVESGIVNEDHVSEAQFLHDFDLMGVQRHLKAIGIFSRLLHRDGKDGYINDIPRTMGYVKDVAGRYPELSEFAAFLEGIDG
ncbi:MAG: phosphotransferase [Gammaproteobacteria bacterium]|nr:phosphotransferase [Gammaproteobacteria bacterium]